MFICKYRLRFKGTLGTQAYCLPLLPEGRRPYILPDHSRPIQVVVDPAITDPGIFLICHSMIPLCDYCIDCSILKKYS